jgi:type I restriction enzyme S subunit
MPNVAPPPGWKWVALTDIARLESGHTPSRQHSEYWGGDIPWIGIRDAKAHHGQTINETIQTTKNSSARILPKGTVCLSRTASVGYVITMGRPMATSQDFANWICSDQIDHRFLVYLFLAEQGSLLRFASGAIHQTIYYPELKALHVCIPQLPEQQRIVGILDEAFAGLATATANAGKNLENASELFDSYLDSVFSHGSKGWVGKTLAEVSKQFGRGKSKHRPRNDPSLYGGKYPFIQTGDIRNANHLIVKYSQTYNEKGLAQSKLWPRGTICITIAANIAETGILDFDACFPDSIIGMVVDPSQTNNKFVEYLLQFFKTILQAQGKGSAQANINLATFERQKFPFPPVIIQNALVERLARIAADVRIIEDSYRARIESISELKRSILHRAFSGGLPSAPFEVIDEAAE